MAYRVRITKQAVKGLQSLPPPMRQRVGEAIASLEDDPRPHGCKKLVGDGRYRLRVGDYRVLYIIVDQELWVTVVRVAHRREVYR